MGVNKKYKLEIESMELGVKEIMYKEHRGTYLEMKDKFELLSLPDGQPISEEISTLIGEKIGLYFDEPEFLEN